MAANYTLTGTFQQLTGSSDPTGKLVITLANFGNLIPKASAIVISAAPITITCSGGTFSQLLYGNDQITPSGTFYTIALFDSTGRFISEAAYQLTGGGTNDLSTLTPLQSNPPAPITAYAPLASPAFTGLPTGPTAAPSTNTTQLATCAFVLANGGGGAVSSVFTRSGAVVATSGDYSVAQVTGAAPLASPTFTGIPAAPTASALTNTTQLATTAYADAAVAVERARAIAAEIPVINTSPDYFLLPYGDVALEAVVSMSTMAQNFGYVCTFRLENTVTYTKASVCVTVADAAAGTFLYVGIYSMAGTLLQTMKVPITAATTGLMTVSAGAVTLSPGSYYLMVASDSATGTLQLLAANLTTTYITAVLNKNQMRFGFKSAQLAAGALAASATFSTFTKNANFAPLIMLEA